MEVATYILFVIVTCIDPSQKLPSCGADSLAVALQASRVRISTQGPFPILSSIALPLRFLSVLI